MLNFKFINDQSKRNNNFDLARLIAALLVVYGHGFAINDSGGYSDILRAVKFTSSHRVGVYMFFLISGYLVTQSIERNYEPLFFIRSRLLRIVPGLFVSLVVTLLIILLISNVSIVNLLFSRDAIRFLVMNSSLIDTVSGNFQGVFEGNKIPGVVNGSLWSIKWELKCYFILFFMLISGANTNKFVKIICYLFVFLLVFAFPVSLWKAEFLSINHICVGFFLAGSLVYQCRNYFPISSIFPMVGFLAIYVLFPFVSPGILDCLRWFTVIFLTFSIAFCMKPLKLPGDYSYGIYLYAFPIQQVVATMSPALNPYLAFGFSLILIIPLAVLSWHLVESKMLKLKLTPLWEARSLLFLMVFSVVFLLALYAKRAEMSWVGIGGIFLMLKISFLLSEKKPDPAIRA